MPNDLLLPPHWQERPYDPETDEAPPYYEEVGEDGSCDGAPDVIRGWGASGTPANRGWGPGWPNCQYSKWVTMSRSDGIQFSVHREIATLSALLYDETERLGYNLLNGQCWCAACRSIRGSSSPSNHSWALAHDLNSAENPMGPRTGRIRRFPRVIAVWKSYGFGWGGDYSGRADDMHFEFLGTPVDARRQTERAKRELGQQEDDMAQVPQKEWDDMKKSVARIEAILLEKDPAVVKDVTGRSTGSIASMSFRIENKLDAHDEPDEPDDG